MRFLCIFFILVFLTSCSNIEEKRYNFLTPILLLKPDIRLTIFLRPSLNQEDQSEIISGNPYTLILRIDGLNSALDDVKALGINMTGFDGKEVVQSFNQFQESPIKQDVLNNNTLYKVFRLPDLYLKYHSYHLDGNIISEGVSHKFTTTLETDFSKDKSNSIIDMYMSI